MKEQVVENDLIDLMWIYRNLIDLAGGDNFFLNGHMDCLPHNPIKLSESMRNE